MIIVSRITQNYDSQYDLIIYHVRDSESKIVDIRIKIFIELNKNSVEEYVAL